MGVETALAIGIPLAIGAIGTLVQSGNRSDISAAGAQKMQGMQNAAGSYAGYRQDQADARMKGMDQQMKMFQGAGNILNAMYGGGGSGSGGYTAGSGGYKPVDGYSLPDGTRTPIDPRTGGPIPSNDYPINPRTGKPYTQAEWDQLMAFQRWQSEQQKNGTYGTGPIFGTPSGSPDGQGGPPIIVTPGEGSGVPGSSGPMLTGELPGQSQMLMSLAGPKPNGPPAADPMIASLARNRSA